ncbi:hypothetical protein TGAMA5MH_10194 [Trichoderma gamsii]|uniref:BZIP domain-containing protein n=1 Tax=Trichoderma gamsii TaxID=398673 RepID=A0A2K0SX95_9HYPO|nr:hypothetical protein TGAMA5MH_10194 [Trichoderma gamsii]
MDSESAMTAALIDPQLELTVQGTTAEGMQYYQALSTSTAFELWNFMFKLIGELLQPAQDMGLMGSDLHSDEMSSLSLSLSTEQDMQFPLSPLDGSANFDESPGGISMSPGLSEAGTLSIDQKTPKAKEAKKARRRRSETEKKEQIKQWNRVAASKCRRKKKAMVDELKEMKLSLEARNNELHMEYQQLR